MRVSGSQENLPCCSPVAATGQIDWVTSRAAEHPLLPRRQPRHGGARVLRRRHRARRGDQTDRRICAGRPSAVALHRRAAVHPVALGLDDGTPRDPIRDAHRPARRRQPGIGRVGADDRRCPVGGGVRDRVLREVASRGGGRAVADRPRIRRVVRASALVRREPVGRQPLVPAGSRSAVVHARRHARGRRPAARRRAAHDGAPARRRRRVQATRDRVSREERRRAAGRSTSTSTIRCCTSRRSRAPSSRARPATATGPTASPNWITTSATCWTRSTSSASPTTRSSCSQATTARRTC